MKTVQEYLGVCDRERLLDALFYDDVLCDVTSLLQHKDTPLAEQEKRYKETMRGFIDHLLEMEPKPADGHILYLYDVIDDTCARDKALDLIKLEELKGNIDCDSYAFDFTDWDEAIGYLVADNKLTQDNMIDLLSQFLQEITFFGIGGRDERIKEVEADLEQGMQEIKEGKTVPAEKVFEDMRREHGWPEPEKDEEQDRLRDAVWTATNEYDRYGLRRERTRILEGLK
ncbi:MAG: hypothetical protein J6M64_12130 [Oscillospiraceae bacterium]|nr:hypothetical protein [Oscillospiraceae bacterium]